MKRKILTVYTYMITKEYFTRKDIADIIDVLPNNFLRIEKNGLVEPRIKPSRFDYNQLIFIYLCKELTKFTKLNWTHITKRLAEFSDENYRTYSIAYMIHYEKTGKTDFHLEKDNKMIEKLPLSFMLFGEKLPIDFDDLTVFSHFLKTEAGLVEITIISIDKIVYKIDKKCQELGIDIDEKCIA